MAHNAGYTQEISEQERAKNEVNTCKEFAELYPLNEYWQYRLAAALLYEHELLQPLTISECIEQAFMLCPEESLNDMTQEKQTEWYEGVQPIEF